MTLEEFFKTNKKVALCFSGGTDSSFLLYTAKKYNSQIKAYFVKTPLQPQFELDDARRLADECKVELEVLQPDVFINEDVVKNNSKRCYFCKKANFSLIKEHAIKDGFTVIIDGNNASDDTADRPGMKACEELKVLSPLRLCGIDKNKVRELSKQAGLFTWNKPSYACLATRITTDQPLIKDTLESVEICEDYLRSLGLRNFRLRINDDTAILVLRENQFDLVFDKRNEIQKFVNNYFKKVFLNLKGG